MADMTSRLASMKSLLPELESALQSFNASTSKFRIVRSVNPTHTQPKTLYILDSSFNPPSVAHFALATSALTNPSSSDTKPHRLLLLFSTQNADKAPSPASFAHRMTMMTLFAEDLSRYLGTSEHQTQAECGDISIDIGLTKEPYYSGKSRAIMNTTPPCYTSNPAHVHLVGYDTLIRFCNPRYYPDFKPPLSALSPFFEAGHTLRITQRPHDPKDKSSAEFGTVKEQEQYIERLRDGELEKQGFQKAWADRLKIVQAAEGVGVSSTRVRNAAKESDWDLVKTLCTEGVAAWLRKEKVYEENASDRD